MTLQQAQKTLRLLGYPVNVDGQFTLQTQQAFTDLQRKHGLVQSGTLDLWTEAKLLELSKNAVPFQGIPPVTGADAAAPMLSPMMQGAIYGALGMGIVGGLGVYLMRRSCAMAQVSSGCGCQKMLGDDEGRYIDAEYEIYGDYE